MAIKVSGTTVIDDSQNVTNAGTGTFSGAVTAASFSGDGSSLTNLPDSGLGIGQTWQSFSVSNRTHSTSYQNTTGKPIVVNVGYSGSQLIFQVSTDGVSWVDVGRALQTSGSYAPPISVVIPDTHYYRLSSAGTAGTRLYWAELR